MYTDKEKLDSLRIALFSLPTGIKDWLTSDEAFYKGEEITKRLNFDIEKRKIISQLIQRLLTQDLNPRDFIGELSHELNISYSAAKALTQEIEEKLFRPIENDLRRDVGLDIKLIYFDQPTAGRKPFEQTSPFGAPFGSAPNIVPNMPIMPPQASETPEINIKPVELPKTQDLSSWARPLEPLANKPTATGPTAKPAGQQAPRPPIGSGSRIDLQKFQIKNSEIPETPFMIHKEESASQTTRPEVPKERLSLNINVANPPSEKPIAQKPITARLETPGLSQTPQQPQAARTVHYSNFLTPLENPIKKQNAPAKQTTPKINNENIIDLRKVKK